MTSEDARLAKSFKTQVEAKSFGRPSVEPKGDLKVFTEKRR